MDAHRAQYPVQFFPSYRTVHGSTPSSLQKQKFKVSKTTIQSTVSFVISFGCSLCCFHVLQLYFLDFRQSKMILDASSIPSSHIETSSLLDEISSADSRGLKAFVDDIFSTAKKSTWSRVKSCYFLQRTGWWQNHSWLGRVREFLIDCQ